MLCWCSLSDTGFVHARPRRATTDMAGFWNSRSSIDLWTQHLPSSGFPIAMIREEGPWGILGAVLSTKGSSRAPFRVAAGRATVDSSLCCVYYHPA